MPTRELLAERVLNAGDAGGPCLRLVEPLNFFGGLDTRTGHIVDPRHPQCGTSLANQILVMPPSRGSGTNAQFFAEVCARGVGPAGVVLLGTDFVVTVGAIVTRRLYGLKCPVFVLEPHFGNEVRNGDSITMTADSAGGRVTVAH